MISPSSTAKQSIAKTIKAAPRMFSKSVVLVGQRHGIEFQPMPLELVAKFLGDFFSGVADAIWNLDFNALVDVFERAFQAIADAVGWV